MGMDDADGALGCEYRNKRAFGYGLGEADKAVRTMYLNGDNIDDRFTDPAAPAAAMICTLKRKRNRQRHPQYRKSEASYDTEANSCRPEHPLYASCRRSV